MSNEDFQGGRLAVDVSVLALLLKRGRSQHRRCIYYRRLSMVLSALRKLPSVDDIADWTARHGRLVRLLTDEEGHKRRREDRWTLERDGGVATVVSAADDELRRNVRELATVRASLSTLATEALPAVLSRILHAAPAVMHEISRGYFLPFMTVALACAARVRTLLMRLGRDAVVMLRESAPALRRLGGRGGAFGELVGAIEPGKGPGEDARSSSEWDSLMATYAEVTDSDLTKRMNEFTRRRRWEHAAARLGRKIPSECKTNDGDSDQPGKFPAESLDSSEVGIERESFDAGEVVDFGSRSPDSSKGAVVQSEARRSADVDDNMARVMQGRRGKEKGEARCTNAKPTSKKKRERTSSSAIGEASATPPPASDANSAEDVGKKKSKRKQKTKKKKKRTKNVIDDIFG